LIPVFAGSNPAKETCERKTTMVIIKTIISTLDIIFMLILFVSGRESKDKETAIALWVLDVAVAEHVSDVEVTECFIVQYLVFAFSCLSFVQRKEYI
jgi:hypothetical protein